VTHRSACFVLSLFAATGSVAAAQLSEPAGTITALRGNLYRAQDGPRVTVFRVEPDAIVLVDPMSSRFARFLEQQFAERFPGRPVKYVVYTGADLERVGGAAVFNRTAEVIAHERFNERSAAARTRAPERGEDVLFAESAFASRRTLLDGESAIDLIYPGPGAGDAQTLVYFRAERVLFAVSHPAWTAPFSNRDVRPTAVAQWTTAVADIEFDLLVDGSGATATRAEVVAADGYARAIMAGLEDANARELSASQLQSGTTVARFDGTPFAQVRDADLAALYRRTSVLVFDAMGSVLANRVPTDLFVCQGNPDCPSRPPTGPALMAGAGFSIGRFRAVGEIGSGARLSLSAYSIRSRTTHVTFLGGLRMGLPGRFNVTPLGGLTYAMNKFSFVLPGFGDGRNFSSEEKFGLTFGADVTAPITRDVALVVPLRFTPGIDLSAGGTHTSLDVRAGVGLSFTYRRQAM
jgi:glyoxylase-like metal-dependent hydrolase (beta-lactamase superfamily II)